MSQDTQPSETTPGGVGRFIRFALVAILFGGAAYFTVTWWWPATKVAVADKADSELLKAVGLQFLFLAGMWVGAFLTLFILARQALATALNGSRNIAIILGVIALGAFWVYLGSTLVGDARAHNYDWRGTLSLIIPYGVKGILGLAGFWLWQTICHAVFPDVSPPPQIRTIDDVQKRFHLSD